MADSKYVISVCVGSSCHLKGSYDIINRLKELISEHGADVTLTASFCMGDCMNGVCVTVNDTKHHGVSLSNVDEFFNQHVLNAD